MNAFAWSLHKVVNYPYVYNEEVWALGDLAPGLHVCLIIKTFFSRFCRNRLPLRIHTCKFNCSSCTTCIVIG